MFAATTDRIEEARKFSIWEGSHATENFNV